MRRKLHFKTATALTMLMLVLVPGATGCYNTAAQETISSGRMDSKTGITSPLKPDAEAWALADLDSGLYLMGKNPDEQLQVGSVTKIMSALVVLQEGVGLDDKVTVSKEAASYVEDAYSNVGLEAGERMTVRDLLAATLISSGDDAVYALAEYVGNGSVDNFVDKMNDQVSSMGLENTHFETPVGLDTSENYSSARDLITITRAVLKYPIVADMVRTRDATIRTENREVEIYNTNQLLATYPKATGVKTGTTPKSGANIVASAEDGNESYIAAVLQAKDSDERFRAAQAILEYGFNRYECLPLVRQNSLPITNTVCWSRRHPLSNTP